MAKVEYAKMKNADLESLLKERGLPHTGKKAELVSRLQDDDDKKVARAPPAAENEDEIDWDDDTAEAPAETTSAPADVDASTETNVEGNNPQAVPNQAAAIDPSSTADLTAKNAEETNGTSKPNGDELSAEEPKPDFSIGLAKTDIELEIEKREKRAMKFKIEAGKEDPAAIEALEKLKRAKKFSVDGAAGDNSQVKGIDQALPERREKRRREGGEDRGDFKRGGRGGGRRFAGGDRSGRGFRDDRRGPPRENRGPREDRAYREPRPERSGGGDRGSWMSEEDRRRAEARRGRFERE